MCGNINKKPIYKAVLCESYSENSTKNMVIEVLNLGELKGRKNFLLWNKKSLVNWSDQLPRKDFWEAGGINFSQKRNEWLEISAGF